MEVLCSCVQTEAFPVTSECTRVLHRLTFCEVCSRTRLGSKLSDCDSNKVVRCRPYRSSFISKKYVNVSAAVCLILLVGGLSPQSSAAPSRSSSKMERQKRATDAQENYLWANPCDYKDYNSDSNLKYEPKKAKEVSSQAKNAYKLALQYQDTFALDLHSFPSFEALLTSWTEHKYLSKDNFPWLDQNVLPTDLIIEQKMTEADMNRLMDNINEALPIMYKALKVIVAGLYEVTNGDVLNSNVKSDNSLKSKITTTMHDVRAVLCLFNELMRSRKLEIMPVYDTDIPKPDIGIALLVYRDTLYYLEFLGKALEKMHDKKV